MKQFPHIISKLFYEPVLITPQKHAALVQVVEAHLSGHLAPTATEKPVDYESDMFRLGNAVVIPVHGIIDQHVPDSPSGGGGCDVARLRSMISVAQADDSIERVVFDFRTPGGAVVGVAETGRKILNITDKETIAFTDDQCCSAGIWLAAQCQKFYATPSAQVGSVGVWCAYLDMSRKLANEGVKVEAFYAGAHKLLGASWKPMTEQEKGIVQGQIDRIYAQFKTAMTEQRAVKDENFGNGLVFDGEQAADLGFIDGTVESLEEVLAMEFEDR